MYQSNLSSSIDAEPLDRHKIGSYHPTTLGCFLSNSRYKILHKLGWGGYSTFWAARYQREDRYVAIKIYIPEERNNKKQRELDILNKITTSTHPGSRYVMQMLDDFYLDGPNGTHCCLVLELLGLSVPDLIEARFADGRFPANIARDVAKQALLGLDFLHEQKVAHGAFAIPAIDNMSEDEFINLLGKPDIGHVYRNDGHSLGPGIPKYIVKPASKYSMPLSNTIKINDFGESFSPENIPKTLHTPLVVRAPEVIFQDSVDYRVDLWGLGCMLFELFAGQPPFESLLTAPKIIVSQMQETTNERLPERWLKKWDNIRGDDLVEIPGPGLQEWLEEVYFDGERKQDLAREDIVNLGQIIQRFLRFEPSARESAREILNDSFFSDWNIKR